MKPAVVHRAIAAWIGLALFAALLALAATPTGAATPEAAVAPDARIAARRDVAPVAVLLTVTRGDLAIVIAHPEDKGWFAAAADPVPRTIDTSWTATAGNGEVPALAAAYGRAAPGSVRVTWEDGATDTVAVASDGLWLAARRGAVRIAKVARLAPNGAVRSEEPGP
jgi:hypothetical protein